jgi:NADH-quinone oxidoreductase subunit C
LSSSETTTDAPEPAPEPEPEPDPVVAELLERITAELGDAVVAHAESFGTLTVRVKPEAWRGIAEFAKRSLDCDFLSFISAIDWRAAAEIAKGALECDYLCFVSGIDWMPAPKEGGDEAGGDTSAPVQPSETTYGAAGSEGRFQVFGRVQSTHRHWGVTLKADVDEDSLLVQSWVPVYAGADWHERECWEMFGVTFDGHPSLRRLYLPAEFEGHPLRKDYPLLARVVKPWPGLVDVEPMPDEDTDATPATSETAEAST